MSYFLSLIYDYRKFIVGGFGALGIVSLVWGALVVLHFEPIDRLEKQVHILSQEVNSTQNLLFLCKNQKKVEVFESARSSRADIVRNYIDRRLESEVFDNNITTSHDWLF